MNGAESISGIAADTEPAVEGLRRRVGRIWADWTRETTPGIFIVLTVVAGVELFLLTAQLVALEYIWVPQLRDIPRGLRAAGWYAPPYIVAVVWALYRTIGFRRRFGRHAHERTEEH